MPDSTRILVVDDHPVFRHGLCNIIRKDSSFALIGEAGDGLEALELIKKLKPDIVVLDIDLPKLNGLEVARQLSKTKTPPRIIVLTMYVEQNMVNAALDAGVSGYVSKENATLDVLQSLRVVAEGECYLSPSISKHLMKRREQSSQLRAQVPGLDQLTPMEKKVLALIAENKTSKEIGAELFISFRTVDTHRRNIALKLNLQGNRRLFQFALENKSHL